MSIVRSDRPMGPRSRRTSRIPSRRVLIDMGTGGGWSGPSVRGNLGPRATENSGFVLHENSITTLSYIQTRGECLARMGEHVCDSCVITRLE